MCKSMQVLIVLLLSFAAYLAGTYQGARDYAAIAAERPPTIDCRKVQPRLFVRDYDGRLWQVDVCAVAQDDAGASQYKEEVK